MKKLTVALAGTEIALVATSIGILYLASHELWITFLGVAAVALALVLGGRLMATRREITGGPTVGVGTVHAVEDVEPATLNRERGEHPDRRVLVQVTGVRGEEFIGRLVHHDGDLDLSMLRPGLVILVAFDPAARERLSLPDDVLAVRTACVKPR
jgi:hypothetical protein